MIHRHPLLLAPAAAVLLLPSGARAATVTVDAAGGGAYTTIMEGIGAASNGDVVEVMPGTYHEDIDFQGKAITVQAVACADETEIVGSGVGPVVQFHTGEGADSVLRGFAISGGNATADSQHGGGVDVYLSSPTLRDLVVRGNTAIVGAGILLNTSNATVQDCTIEDNSTTAEGAGGGLYSYLGNPVLEDVELTGNHADDGAGLYLWGGAPQVRDTAIVGNVATGYGGGVRIDQASQPHFTRALIQSNQAEGAGGVYLAVATATFEDSIFQANTANGSGAGLAVYGTLPATPSLVNCRFQSNSAANLGGGVYLDETTSLTVSRSEFIQNHAQYGAGIFVETATVDVSRSVFHQNNGTSGAALYANASTVHVDTTVFADNAGDASGGNGGAMALDGAAQAELRATSFVGNSAYSGGGLHIRADSFADVENCSFVGNSSAGSAAGIRVSTAGLSLTNSILAFCPDGSALSAGAADAVEVDYTDVYSNPAGNFSGGMADPSATGVILEVDPGFVSYTSDGNGLNDDLHLEAGSPVADMGDPAGTLDDPDGSRNDMGAYGGPAAAGWTATEGPDVPAPASAGADLEECTGEGDDDDSTPGDDDDGTSDDDATGDDDDDGTSDDDAAGDDDDTHPGGGDDGCSCRVDGSRPIGRVPSGLALGLLALSWCVRRQSRG